MSHPASQDRSRRLRWLIGAAIVVIYLGLCAVTALLASVLLPGDAPARAAGAPWWMPEVYATLLVLHLAVVGGSMWQMRRSLLPGSPAVPEILGARELLPHGADADALDLIEVTEDTALAHGVSPPRVFVLPGQPGLNALFAGDPGDDGVIVVTSGGLRDWTREEMTAVVAHGFARMARGGAALHREMTIGLAGLVGVAELGERFIAGGHRWFVGIASGQKAERLGRAGNIALAGLAAIAIGAVGALVLGKLILAAGWVGVIASRLIRRVLWQDLVAQADAASARVVGHRAPLLAALDRVGRSPDGSRVRHPVAEELAHHALCTVLAPSGPARLFDPHPALPARARRISPGHRPAAHGPRTTADSVSSALDRTDSLEDIVAGGERVAPLPVSLPNDTDTVRSTADDTCARVGEPSAAHLQLGAHLRQAIPPLLAEEIHTASGAAAVVLGLLLPADTDARHARRTELLETLSEPVAASLQRVEHDLAALPLFLHLPTVELALPALRRLSPGQQQTFLEAAGRLVAEERPLSVFRFALRALLKRRLQRRGTDAQATEIRPAIPDFALLLSTLAWVGHDHDHDVEHAFARGADRLIALRGSPVALLDREKCTFAALDGALDRLVRAAPPLRQQTIDACIHCVLADGAVTLEEAELLRLVVELLGGTLPPFLPSAQ